MAGPWRQYASQKEKVSPDVFKLGTRLKINEHEVCLSFRRQNYRKEFTFVWHLDSHKAGPVMRKFGFRKMNSHKSIFLLIQTSSVKVKMMNKNKSNKILLPF